MKKYFAGLICGALLMLSIPSIADTVDVAFNKIKVTVNGSPVQGDNVLINGRTYLPLRSLGEILGKEISWDASTSTADIKDKTTQAAAPNTNMEEFKAYLADVEQQTNRAIGEEQNNLVLDYVSKNSVSKLDSNTLAIRRADFDKKKKSILEAWTQHTGKPWPTYQTDVLSAKGTVLRKAGSNYDAHHLVELSFGGPNEWWNIQPAAYPNEHQGGIHRAGGPASKLFDDDNN